MCEEEPGHGLRAVSGDGASLADLRSSSVGWSSHPHLPGFLEEIEGDLYVLVTYCCSPDSTPRLSRLLSQVSAGHESGQGLVGSFGSGSLTRLHGQGPAS